MIVRVDWGGVGGVIPNVHVSSMSDVKTADYSKKCNNDLRKGGVRQVVPSGEGWES